MPEDKLIAQIPLFRYYWNSKNKVCDVVDMGVMGVYGSHSDEERNDTSFLPVSQHIILCKKLFSDPKKDSNIFFKINQFQIL